MVCLVLEDHGSESSDSVPSGRTYLIVEVMTHPFASLEGWMFSFSTLSGGESGIL